MFTLLAFHFGAAVSFFAVKLMGVRGAWVNIILAAVAFIWSCARINITPSRHEKDTRQRVFFVCVCIDQYENNYS